MRSKSSLLQSASNYAGVKLGIEYVPLDQLQHPANETRTHSKAQLRKIARSIAEHGFVVPVCVYGANIIATGNARVRAAKIAGLVDVPVIRLEHMTDEQARMFAIADNKLIEGGEWNTDALRIEFDEIALAAPGIDLGSSGSTIGERDVIVGRHRTDQLADLDNFVAQDDLAPVSRLGDVFLLGRHRLVCGDARDPAAVEAATSGKAVRTLLSDLPYNVKIEGNVSGKGEHKHGDFAMASGEMSPDEFTAFLATAIAAAQPHLVDGALAYLFMDWRHLSELAGAAERCSLKQLNLLVWAKTNAGQGSFYRSAHELVGIYKHGNAPHTNNVMLGSKGRYRTNVLNYPGVNTFTKGAKAALKLHPTVKPIALIADLILDSSAPGELILDPFGGSDTTLIAAEKMDRTAALIEYEPGYVDTAVRRFEAAFDTAAVLEGTGQTFADLAAERRAAEEA
jgi:DNA modification methylase